MTLVKLSHLDIEDTTYLYPEEVIVILKTHNLDFFSFSPKWLKPQGDGAKWIEIYESVCFSKVQWGEHFINLYKRLKWDFVSEVFMNMYNDAPLWALSDISDSDTNGSDGDSDTTSE